MYDFYVILGMDWLSTHRASVDCFTKKVVFRNPGYPELEFEGDRRVLPTCVVSALDLAHVVDKSFLEVTLKSVP